MSHLTFLSLVSQLWSHSAHHPVSLTGFSFSHSLLSDGRIQGDWGTWNWDLLLAGEEKKGLGGQKEGSLKACLLVPPTFWDRMEMEGGRQGMPLFPRFCCQPRFTCHPQCRSQFPPQCPLPTPTGGAPCLSLHHGLPQLFPAPLNIFWRSLFCPFLCLGLCACAVIQLLPFLQTFPIPRCIPVSPYPLPSSTC